MNGADAVPATHAAVAAIPVLGAGLGYRAEMGAEILAAREDLDFVEVIADNFLDGAEALAELEQLCSVMPVIPHGVGLSIGSGAPPDRAYLRAIRRVSDLTGAPYYSEHLCLTRVPGIDIGHLAPLWFTEDALVRTVQNVLRVQDYLGKPLALENVTYLLDIPGGDMPQAGFFHRLVAATGCGVLLDITNVYINSVNHDFDPLAFLDALPLESVVQVHLAGGYWARGILVDGHSEPVDEASWRLFAALVARVPVRGVIIEHDDNFPALDLLLAQVARARQIRNSTGKEVSRYG